MDKPMFYCQITNCTLESIKEDRSKDGKIYLRAKLTWQGGALSVNVDSAFKGVSGEFGTVILSSYPKQYKVSFKENSYSETAFGSLRLLEIRKQGK